METLNNFNLNYFFIIFIIIEVIMLFILFIITKEPKNKVKFFVCKQPGIYDGLRLFLGKPTWDKNTSAWIVDKSCVKLLATNFTFTYYNLNPADFDDMKIGEIKEVFLNFED